MTAASNPAIVPEPHAAISDRVIRVSAIAVRDAQGRVLNVRKRGTAALMLPGGKPELGESAAACAAREFSEELGFDVAESSLTLLGVFRTVAANEPGYALEATVFTHPFEERFAAVAPLAELDLVEWVDPTEKRADLAPLNTEWVFPALLAS